ncbi:MAG: tetratricopeptide repeat protein [Anaerolineae bacterium]
MSKTGFLRSGLWYLGLVLLLFAANARAMAVAWLNNMGTLALVREWPSDYYTGLPPSTPRTMRSMAKSPLDQAWSLDADNWHVLLNLSRVALLEGRHEEACSLSHAAVRRDPSSDLAKGLLADSLLAAHREAAALRYYDAGDLLNRGRAALAAGQRGTALMWLQMSVRVRPTLAAAEALAELLNQGGQPVLAALQWIRLAQSLPNGESLRWLALAKAAETARNAPMALVCYATMAERGVRDVATLRALARTYEALGDLGAASACLEEATLQRPYDPSICFALGRLALLREDYASASVWYAAGARLDPRSERVAFYLGYSHFMAGELAQARSWLDQALRADPNHCEAHAYRASVARALGELDLAAYHMRCAERLGCARGSTPQTGGG